MHVDILAELQERSVQRAVDRLERQFNNINAEVGVDVKATEIKAAAEKIRREFSDIRQEIKVNVDDNSIRRATRSLGDFNQESRRTRGLIEEIGTAAFRTSRGLISIGAPIALKGLVDLTSVAVTASQSIALLPSVLAAGGAAMGTLQLATSGVGDALDTVFDPKKRQHPEKFAAAIQSLSPAAQQAVLSIRALVPEFDALKSATQDAFFAGISDQIQNLTRTYLPSIQTMTTGIAGAFNQMMTGIGNQLATAGTQNQIKTTMDNIVLAFQNAAPAAQSFTQAFIDIMQVGSEFLPGFGTGIANVAQEFANFIREARDSGQLKVWIQEGIDAVGALSNAIIDLTKLIYEAFGSDPQGNIERFNNDIATTSELLKLASGDTHQWGISWNQELDSMQGPLGQLRDGIMDIPEALSWMANKAIDAFNAVKHGIEDMARNAQNFLAFLNPFGGAGPAFQPLPDIPHLPAGGDWGGHQTGPFGRPAYGGPFTNSSQGAIPAGPTIPVAPHQPNRTSRPGQPPLPGPPPGSVYGVPAAPPTGPAGKKPTDKERRDAIAAGLDPNSYRIDPYAQVPGLPPGVATLPKGAQGPMGMTTGTPYGGTYQQDPQKILEAQHSVESAGHDLEEARKDRLVLEKDNQASAQDISDAKWKETEAGWKLQKEQANLADAIQGTYNKTTDASNSLASAMGELGAGLDKDLGLSKGLPGLADNLVRFLGNLALAPAMAQMAMTKATSPSQGGYGLMGILGAQGAFGPRFTGLSDPTTGGSTGASQYTSGNASQYSGGLPGMADAAVQSYGLPPGTDTGGYGTGTSATFPPWVMALSQQFGVTPSTYPGHQESNRNEPGYAPNPQHLNRGIDWTGTPEAMQRFAQAMASNPLAEQVIFNGAAGAVEAVAGQPRPGYFAGDLAAHGGHVHTRFAQDPTGGGYGDSGAPGGYQQMGSTPFGSIPIPLPVTIVGGGGGGAIGPMIGAGAGAPLGGGGLSPQQWNNIMGAEAGGSGGWAANTGNGYFGGLQFTQPSWAAAGGTRYAPRADLASPSQQMAAGNNLLALQGPGAWPATSAAHPEWFSTTGGSTALPTSGFGGTGMPFGLSPAPGIGGPGVGGAAGMGIGTGPGVGSAAGTRIGGLAPIAPNPGGGGVGITPGGSIDTAANLAAMAFPGVGQAAATGMKLASRAIQYAGQVAGIGVSGLMETFLPTGGSELANNNWLTRIAGAVAGAAPALPNIAGGMAGKAQMQGQPPVNPADVSGGQGAGAPPGPTINLQYNNNRATEDRAGADITNHLRTQYTPPGRQYGG